MKCIKCGNELVENAQFCTSCGASQKENTQPVNPTPEQVEPNAYAPNQPPVVPSQQSVVQNQPVVVPASKKREADVPFIMKLVMNAMGAFSGILSIIFGIIVASINTGFYTSIGSYGGDAYTGIQNAAAYTAKNVLQTNRILETGLCFILIVIGLAIISYFVPKLLDVIFAKKGNKNEENK